jgi:hypothetical protein
MKEIFLAIQNLIKANVPQIRMIEIDLGQLEEETSPLSYPCVLVGFDETINFSYLSNNIQQGDVAIAIKVAFKVLEKTHSINTTSVQAQALAHYDDVQQLTKQLNTLQGECFTSLNRRGISQVKRRDLRVFELTFNTTLTEDLTLDTAKYVNWKNIPNFIPASGPVLQITTDMLPAPNNYNINHIPDNQQINYHETLDIENLDIEGELIEI